MKLRRMLCILISISMIIMLGAVQLPVSASDAEIWDGSIASSFLGGDGSADDPYKIANGAQLAFLAQRVNAGDENYTSKNYILTSDIVLNNTEGWERWETTPPSNEWMPIGANFPFSGVFDGNGRKVRGVYINSESDNQGLLGYISEGTVQNLGVADSFIKGGIDIGGVIGVANYGSTVINCYNTSTVSGTSDVGGVVGNITNSSVTNCHNTGTVSGTSDVGGIAGHVHFGTVTNCYNTGTVNGTGYYVGGIAGCVRYGTVLNCYNAGTVSGTSSYSNIGGVAGYVDYSTVANCYNAGTVSDTGSYSNIGGIAGYAEYGNTIINCYNIGNVSCTSSYANVGGIAGDLSIGTAVRSCYYLSSSVAENNEYGTLLTNEQMTDMVNYAGFDFDTVWVMDNSSAYEYPQLRGNRHIGNLEIWDGSVADTFAGGDGSEDDPYQIANGAQLAFLAQRVNAGDENYNGKNYILTSDIVLNNTADWEEWETTPPENEWTPIGTDSNPFYGVFNGNGCKVRGVYINRESDYQGLFGYIVGMVKNIGVVCSYIKGNAYVGGIAGNVWRHGSIVTDCYNTGTVRGTDFVGGIAGNVGLYSTVTGCYNTGAVSGINSYSNIGGIAGNVDLYSTVTGCFNTGTVSGISSYSNIGGIAGNVSYYSTVTGCFNIGTISCTELYSYVGSIAGAVYEYSTVTNCYNTGTVRGTYSVGGIAGCTFTSTVENCYNTGAITIMWPGIGGGIVGSVKGSTLTNCYNIGTVNNGKLSFNTGDIAVHVESSTITNCYYLNRYVTNNNLYGTALTKEQMTDKVNYFGIYDGFDFDSVWSMGTGSGYEYPELRSNRHKVAGIEYSVVSLEGGGMEIQVTPSNIAQGSEIIAALYKDQQLIGIKKLQYKGKALTFTFYEDADQIKIMAWEDIQNLRPLIPIKTVDMKQ